MSTIDGATHAATYRDRNAITHMLDAQTGYMRCGLIDTDIAFVSANSVRMLLCDDQPPVISWCRKCLLTVDPTGDTHLAAALLSVMARATYRDLSARRRLTVAARKIMRSLVHP